MFCSGHRRCWLWLVQVLHLQELELRDTAQSSLALSATRSSTFAALSFLNRAVNKAFMRFAYAFTDVAAEDWSEHCQNRQTLRTIYRPFSFQARWCLCSARKRKFKSNCIRCVFGKVEHVLRLLKCEQFSCIHVESRKFPAIPDLSNRSELCLRNRRRRHALVVNSKCVLR